MECNQSVFTACLLHFPFFHTASPTFCALFRAGENSFMIPPPGIAYIIGSTMFNFNWTHHGDHRTGRFRYWQSSFDVNELVAALGVVQPGQDASGAPVKTMLPIRADALSPQFLAEHKWEV